MDLRATIYFDELVAKCQQGDALSYEALYHRYSRSLFNTSFRILNNRSDAEDVLQESFTSAFQYLNEFDHSSSFGAWIKRIVINKSIDVLRRRRLTIVEMDESTLNGSQELDNIDEAAIKFKVEAIRKGMAQLPSGYRTVLSLSLFEGYDYDEIAAMMNISAVTVRTQYHRARKKLLYLIQKEVSHD